MAGSFFPIGMYAIPQVQFLQPRRCGGGDGGIIQVPRLAHEIQQLINPTYQKNGFDPDWPEACNTPFRSDNPPNGANMTRTINNIRSNRVTKTVTDVQTMLYDIATVLRLSAMVKDEILRDAADEDCRELLTRREARARELTPALA